MDSRPLYSIVVPIHNEARYVTALVADMADEVVSATGRPQELWLVENGSTDTTAVVAEQAAHLLRESGWAATVIELETPDYGAAMKAGFLAATGEWIVNFDIDFFSGPFVAGLSDVSADVVLASKRDPASDDRRSLLRRTATFGFNMLLRYALRSNVTDTHGIKAFRREVTDRLIPNVLRTEDLFDTELVLRAERAGYSIIEVPVVVEERRQARSSLVKRIPRTLRGILQLRGAFASERRNTRSR